MAVKQFLPLGVQFGNAAAPVGPQKLVNRRLFTSMRAPVSVSWSSDLEPGMA